MPSTDHAPLVEPRPLLPDIEGLQTVEGGGKATETTQQSTCSEIATAPFDIDAAFERFASPFKRQTQEMLEKEISQRRATELQLVDARRELLAAEKELREMNEMLLEERFRVMSIEDEMDSLKEDLVAIKAKMEGILANMQDPQKIVLDKIDACARAIEEVCARKETAFEETLRGERGKHQAVEDRYYAEINLLKQELEASRKGSSELFVGLKNEAVKIGKTGTINGQKVVEAVKVHVRDAILGLSLLLFSLCDVDNCMLCVLLLEDRVPSSALFINVLLPLLFVFSRCIMSVEDHAL